MLFKNFIDKNCTIAILFGSSTGEGGSAPQEYTGLIKDIKGVGTSFIAIELIEKKSKEPKTLVVNTNYLLYIKEN